jgi:putative aldouronate transport system permease protein
MQLNKSIEVNKSLKNEGFLSELVRNKVLFVMLIPALLFFIINSYLPMIGIYYAFTRFNFQGGLFGSPFIGMKNFEFLAKSNILFNITKNTILYNLSFIVIANSLQIFSAILLSKLIGNAFRRITQSLMFLPYFVSYVILSVLVYNLFNYDYGFVNTTLKSMNIPIMDFYNMPNQWPFFIIFFYLWKWIGYGTVIYLATILGISQEFYEAAEIDGANVFQQIRHITLPLLKPTFIILVLFALGTIMRGQFELFYQMVGNNGNLFNTTDIIDTYVYRSLMYDFDVGMGTAAGLYQSVFGFVLIVTVNFLVKRKNPEYALF